jgi:hypothetical protein
LGSMLSTTHSHIKLYTWLWRGKKIEGLSSALKHFNQQVIKGTDETRAESSW